MIVTVTLNPALDKLMTTKNFRLNQISRAENIILEPGGKGINVGYALSVLGHEVVVMGFVGGRVGDFIEQQLRDAGLTTNFVHLENETRTNYIIMDEQRRTQTQINEPGPLVQPAEMDLLKENFSRALSYAKMVVIGGSLPPGIDPFSCVELVKMAQAKDVPVAINFSESPFSVAIKSHPYLAKPDIRISPTFMNKPMKFKRKRVEVVRKLAQEANVAMLSLGFETLIASEDKVFEITAPVCEVASTVRINDALLAGTIDAPLENKSIDEAGREGMATAMAITSSLKGEIESKEAIEAHLDQVEVKEIEA
jgi:1-phosphofructokinase family hexose kinase